MDRGAHFHRCDFQVHTPRDLNWSGAWAVTDEERKSCAAEFVAACRNRGLEAVAITDHHDVAFFPYIRRAAEEETDEHGKLLEKRRRLVVFPGMELTLGVPCQALLILDADFPENLLDTLHLALATNHVVAASQAKHSEVVRLEHIQSIRELCERLDEHSHFRHRYIVLPNVGENGQFSLVRKGLAAQYKNMPFVGGYVDGALDKLGTGNLAIVNGRSKEWGNKALGLFQTSDNRKRSFEDLGKHHTWVKWAEPTAEALRQACLARYSRISQTEPTLPAVHITRVDVSNSRFLGPVDLALNSQYNVLIGGRGTGKSSILEYIRWALCDQVPKQYEDDLAELQQRRRSLIEKTLTEFKATVNVYALINGTEHVVRRHATDDRIRLKVGSAEYREATEDEVRALLPLQAYSQKQLSSVGIRSDELLRFVSLPIQGQLTALRHRFDEAAARLRSLHDSLREERRIRRERHTAETEMNSVQQRLEGLRKSLKGLSEEDEKVIGAQAAWAHEQQIINQWQTELQEGLDALTDVENMFKDLPTTSGTGPFADAVRLDAIKTILTKQFAEAVEHVARAKEALGGDELRGLVTAWNKAAAENKTKYEEAKGRAEQNEAALNQISALERRQADLTRQLTELDRSLADLDDPATRLAEQQANWVKLHEERSKVYLGQARVLSEQSGGSLRATVATGAEVDRIGDLLRGLVKGTKIRSEKIDSLLSEVSTSTMPVERWLSVVDELRVLSEHQEPEPVPACPHLSQAGLSTDHQRRLGARVAEQGYADLLAAELGDKLGFKYRVREDEFIAFSDASAGQQATALMRVLLNQGGPPLLIDQPEDDLDNHVLSEIVEQVWVAKSKRQLIFASHNANLVVNGDAELVACCDYRAAGDHSGGTITAQGAIDVESVRAEIAKVMEGGEEAFKLRKEKYGF